MTIGVDRDVAARARSAARTSSSVTPGASSRRIRSLRRYVDRRHVGDDPLDDALPVSGSERLAHNFVGVSLGDVLHHHDHALAPWTRSIAPPMPLTILPGIIQFARSPRSETCIAPSTARSMWPPRIIPNESAESKNDAPAGRSPSPCRR